MSGQRCWAVLRNQLCSTDRFQEWWQSLSNLPLWLCRLDSKCYHLSCRLQRLVVRKGFLGLGWIASLKFSTPPPLNIRRKKKKQLQDDHCQFLPYMNIYWNCTLRREGVMCRSYFYVGNASFPISRTIEQTVILQHHSLLCRWNCKTPPF